MICPILSQKRNTSFVNNKLYHAFLFWLSILNKIEFILSPIIFFIFIAVYEFQVQLITRYGAASSEKIVFDPILHDINYVSKWFVHLIMYSSDYIVGLQMYNIVSCTCLFFFQSKALIHCSKVCWQNDVSQFL